MSRKEIEMNKKLLKIESMLKAISLSELRKNSRASAKALEIKQMIADLKNYQNSQTTKGVFKYINAKMLLEN